MARAESDKESNREIQRLERFEQALRGAYDDPWWREFIALLQHRKQEFLEQLAAGTFDQRQEDRIRGQIGELNYIIILDKYGETHQTVKEKQHARE